MSAHTRDITVDRGLAKNAEKVHGVNPVFLVEKIIRERILDSVYWKRDCFQLSILTIMDKAVSLRLIGTYADAGNTRASHFICLLLKLLQLQPPREFVLYFLRNPHFKYLSVLAALYIRMTFSSADVYRELDPMLNDYRKLRIRNSFSQRLEIIHMDELIDRLLNDEKFCDLILPRLLSRFQLEEMELLEPRESVLESELESDDE